MSDCFARTHHTRSVEAKQLDEGVDDTLVSVAGSVKFSRARSTQLRRAQSYLLTEDRVLRRRQGAMSYKFRAASDLNDEGKGHPWK